MEIQLKKAKDYNKPKKYKQYIKFLFMNQVRELFNKRNKIINNKFHEISNYFTKYCIKNNVGKVILGINKGWKTNVNMGKKNNDIFYKIPYGQLKNKLLYKLENKNIQLIEQEESYTSKCDSLNHETIEKQIYIIDGVTYGNYDGKRIKRGLFKSRIGETINADLNGSINIYRKALNLQDSKNGYKFNFELLMNIQKLKNISKITL